MGGDGRDKQWGILTPPPWNREELYLQTQLRWGRRSQAGNLGVSEKVRRQDAVDRDEIGDHKRVSPKVPGGDHGVHGTLILHPSPPHPTQTPLDGEGRENGGRGRRGSRGGGEEKMRRGRKR